MHPLDTCRVEGINKGLQHFQIGVVSKLASKFLPDNAFSMAASKRLPYGSYYFCCVSFPFGLCAYKSAITSEGCVVSTILAQIIFGIQERARWRRYEWL